MSFNFIRGFAKHCRLHAALLLCFIGTFISFTEEEKSEGCGSGNKLVLEIRRIKLSLQKKKCLKG
jgi:hypothetical protein